MQLRRYISSACCLITALHTLACSPRETRPADYLSDQYLPSAAAPKDVQHADPSKSLIEHDGDTRRQLVTAPSGGAFWLRWQKVSESVGTCNSGRLIDGLKLPKTGSGYRHIGDSPYGTDETVTYLRFAAWAVNKQFPNTVPVVIGDLSDAYGGHLEPHRSHQSGRDADVGFYRSKNRSLRWFKTLPSEELDLAKSWAFIEALLRTGAVEYIFIDRSLQRALFSHALELGFKRAELERIFQYPGKRQRTIIRHVSGHKNHLHVRFICPAEDEDCQ